MSADVAESGPVLLRHATTPENAVMMFEPGRGQHAVSDTIVTMYMN